MAKNYKTLKGCVTRMHRVIYEAYDKGYLQGRKDYERPRSEWKPVFISNGYMNFECGKCKERSIAKYLFCPNCGSSMTEIQNNENERSKTHG